MQEKYSRGGVSHKMAIKVSPPPRIRTLRSVSRSWAVGKVDRMNLSEISSLEIEIFCPDTAEDITYFLYVLVIFKGAYFC